MNQEELKQLLTPITIVKVLKIFKHPYADKLNLVAVDLGGKVKVVITGAQNMNEGDFVPYLSEGNTIPGYLLNQGEKVVLGKKMLRNLESDSMLLAQDEIGIGDDHSVLYIIEAENKEELLGKSILEIISEEMLIGMLDSKSETVHF